MSFTNEYRTVCSTLEIHEEGCRECNVLPMDGVAFGGSVAPTKTASGVGIFSFSLLVLVMTKNYSKFCHHIFGLEPSLSFY